MYEPIIVSILHIIGAELFIFQETSSEITDPYSKAPKNVTELSNLQQNVVSQTKQTFHIITFYKYALHSTAARKHCSELLKFNCKMQVKATVASQILFTVLFLQLSATSVDLSGYLIVAVFVSQLQTDFHQP